MKINFLVVFLLLGIVGYSQEIKLSMVETETVPLKDTIKENDKNQDKVKSTIYDYVVKDISGNDFKLSSLKGKKIMIVNTASECGLTPQYAELEKLSKKFKGKLVIVGFPANNFGSQEPGDNKQIATFCKKNYGVTFPMMSKISVKGNDMAPIYHYLTERSKNQLQDSEVEWNFQKYLIDENGHLVRVVDPKVLPTDESIVAWIKS